MSEKQKRLFLLGKQILDIQYPYPGEWSFGGGTALSEIYWNHRFSEDIDLFLHRPFGIEFLIPNSRNRALQKAIFSTLLDLGFTEHYYNEQVRLLEYVFEDDTKLQFLNSPPITDHPTEKWSAYGCPEISIDTPYETIAKKLLFRYNKAIARDFIDIAIFIHRMPTGIESLLRQEVISHDLLEDYTEIMEKLLENPENARKIEQEAARMVYSPYMDIAKSAMQTVYTHINDLLDREIIL